MGQQDNLSYEFGRFRVNVAERVLLRDGEIVPLTPKVFDILKRAAAADPGVPGTAKGQALITDPNRKRADDLGILLRGLGYEVEIYSSGR